MSGTQRVEKRTAQLGVTPTIKNARHLTAYLYLIGNAASDADGCANCSTQIGLSRLECDACGWMPKSKFLRQQLRYKKDQYYETVATTLNDWVREIYSKTINQ